MSAANPLENAPSVGSDARAHDPSMEEILASIRRIIADDQAAPRRSSPRDIPALRAEPHRASPETAPAVSPLPVNRLSEAATMASHYADSAPGHASGGAAAAPSSFGTVAAPQFPTAMPADMPAGGDASAPEPAEPTAELEAELPPEPEVAAPQPVAPAMVAPSMVAPAEPEVAAAFDEGRKPMGASPDELFSSQTDQSVVSAFNMLAATRLADNSEELLGMVREMIRPLLRTWLDDNLPSMVERLVRAEIERVARGPR